jgi:hypothetical protein
VISADDTVTGNADEENKLIQKLSVGKLQIIMHGQIIRKKLQRQFTCCNLVHFIYFREISLLHNFDLGSTNNQQNIISHMLDFFRSQSERK